MTPFPSDLLRDEGEEAWIDYIRAVNVDQEYEAVKAAFMAGFVSSNAKVALWMMERSYATGHGDTVADMLGELEAQAKERARPSSHASLERTGDDS